MIFLTVVGNKGLLLNSYKVLDFSQFVKYHISLPLLAWLALLLCFQYTQIDVWLAKHFYNTALQQWPYREHWLLQAVIHKTGRNAVYAVGGGMLICLIMSCRTTSKLSPYRRALAFLVMAGVTGPLVITYLKSHTHIYCPWDVSLFGGSKPHIKLFDSISDTLSVGHCFPAGHSSLGFTLVNLYFFCLIVKPAYKFYGLAIGLLTGTVFAMAQEIRGAHFLSHDLFTLAVCWFCSATVFMLFFRKHLLSATENFPENIIPNNVPNNR
ncbi:phosphatase PAP2 family protein [Crenothrix sp.]|uniref:phosphatase PAP2 family protein n=1 Tax=Crenothrix sp. TaxID=3100433 RepID=UPI00374DDB58